MKAIVINMADEERRMAFQHRQLQQLGISYERMNAVTVRDLPFPHNDPFWQKWERPMRTVEMAAYASHRQVWQIVSQSQSPILVLEDDALLLPGVPALLDRIVDLERLDHLTLEFRGRKKLVSKKLHPQAPIRRLWQDREGAAAYVLWPSGARKLLAKKAGLADAVICAAYDMNSFQADPALAIQIDQCERHGIEPPIAVASSILAAAKPPLGELSRLERYRYRMRRVLAQARMGVRHLAHFWNSERRFITLDQQRPTGKISLG